MRLFARILLGIIFGTVIMLSLASCSPKIIQTTTKTTKDSVVTKIVEKHDTVKIAGEKVYTAFQIPCPEPIKPVHEVEKKGRASLTVDVSSSGKSTVECECDSIKKVLSRFDTVTHHFRTTKETEHDTKLVYKEHWYTVPLLLWFVLTIAVIGTRLYLKFKP